MSRLALMIEDDPDQRRFLERLLVGSGWRVVLDTMMPKLNGYQTCRRLKADPATSAVPVVIVSTKDQPAEEFWAREVGADAFLAKPVDIRDMVDLLNRLAERA